MYVSVCDCEGQTAHEMENVILYSLGLVYWSTFLRFYAKVLN